MGITPTILGYNGYNGGIIGHQWDVNGMILGQQWMGSLVISWNCYDPIFSTRYYI